MRKNFRKAGETPAGTANERGEASGRLGFALNASQDAAPVGEAPPGPDNKRGEAPGETPVGGVNAVLAALKSRGAACRTLWVAENRGRSGATAEILALAGAAGAAIKFVPRAALDRLCGRSGHQGVAAVFAAVPYRSWEEFTAALPAAGPALVLVLDRVTDPGNLGALLRSALAFGARGAVVPRDRAAPLTPAALKAAAGAAESLPLTRVVNLRRALEELKARGFWAVGADARGPADLFEFDFPSRAAVVLGSEGRGLSPLIQKTCDVLAAAPQASHEVPSLNVAAAGALFMAEHFRRTRRADFRAGRLDSLPAAR